MLHFVCNHACKRISIHGTNHDKYYQVSKCIAFRTSTTHSVCDLEAFCQVTQVHWHSNTQVHSQYFALHVPMLSIWQTSMLLADGTKMPFALEFILPSHFIYIKVGFCTVHPVVCSPPSGSTNWLHDDQTQWIRRKNTHDVVKSSHTEQVNL